MRVVCISDTHNMHHRLVMPKGDLLLHAGDATMGGKEAEAMDFLRWFAKQEYDTKLFIPGNHDFFFEKLTRDGLMKLEDEVFFNNKEAVGVSRILLYPQASYYEQGYSILGFPWSLPFGPWAYMAPDEKLEEMLEGVSGHDILLCHGPAKGMLDKTLRGPDAGSEAVADWIKQYQPALVVCGHIHESRGAVMYRNPDDEHLTAVVNAACCDYPKYDNVRPPIVLDINRKTTVELV